MGSKPTQLWPGQRMRAFFRSIFIEEQGVSELLADRLAEVCERHINRMLVWDGQPVKRSRSAAPSLGDGSVDAEMAKVDEQAGVESRDGEPAEGDVSKGDVAEVGDIDVTEAGAPWPVAHLDESIADTEPSQVDAPQAFDPFAFSAVVILARSGADALRAKLKDIKDPEHLRSLADAQHLGVDPELRGDVRALRKAIVSGAKQRLADRRAAAS